MQQRVRLDQVKRFLIFGIRNEVKHAFDGTEQNWRHSSFGGSNRWCKWIRSRWFSTKMVSNLLVLQEKPLISDILALWLGTLFPSGMSRCVIWYITITYLHIYLLTYFYLLTYPMEHSPSGETNGFSASEEIRHILCNPKVHYRVYKSPPPVPILSHINPIHASISLPEVPS